MRKEVKTKTARENGRYGYVINILSEFLFPLPLAPKTGVPASFGVKGIPFPTTPTGQEKKEGCWG